MSRTPAAYSLTVVRGATWEDSLTYTDEDKQPVDLTGYEARMHVRPLEQMYGTEGEPTLELSTEPAGGITIPTPTDGTMQIRLAPAAHAALNPANAKKAVYAYSIELFIPEGTDPEYVIPLVEGRLSVRGEVTR